jgi:hypothetical protein
VSRIAIDLSPAACELLETDDDAKLAMRGLAVHGAALLATREAWTAVADEFETHFASGEYVTDNPGSAKRCALAAAKKIRKVLAIGINND